MIRTTNRIKTFDRNPRKFFGASLVGSRAACALNETCWRASVAWRPPGCEQPGLHGGATRFSYTAPPFQSNQGDSEGNAVKDF